MAVNKNIKENRLDFFFDLHSKGVDIGDENRELLRREGYFDKDFKKQEPVDSVKDQKKDKIVESRFEYQSEKNIETDKRIDIIVSNGKPESHSEVLYDKELEERRALYNHIFEGRTEPIRKEEWMPKSVTEHTPEFVAFITSILDRGFHEKIYYRPFALYVQQAYTWLQDKRSSSDFEDDDEREDYQMSEIAKCDENSLYFLNKYGYYKEGDDETGRVKYVARPVHELMAFLDDCGYSVAIAKGRQIAATTTLMMLDVKDVIFKTNHFMKFITEDKDKAEEIFEDKLKYPFSQLPNWMMPNVLNERDNLFKTGYKPEKGKKEGVGSKILVVAPKKTAIAGGAPQKVKIDEAGNIPILGQMIANARPTMMWFNPKTKKIQIKRRLWYWGTGGEMEKGGKAFEEEFMSLVAKWKEGDYSAATIPIFFNWRCRPGATDEDYEREKRVAYAKEGTVEGKRLITEFHQSWPESLADVFRTTGKTLVDEDVIETSLERIRKSKKEQNFTLTKHGFFEPIYDTSQPTQDGSDVPFKIIGATFIPTSDIDERACVEIFLDPVEGWVDRYFKGTDPIDTDTGLSYFASTVWDKYYKTPAAILNWRTRDYRQVFLQSLLLSLYYDTKTVKKGIRDLIESNRGTSYYQYIENKGYGNEAVLNYQLPHAFQNKTTINEGVGIDNKGIRNTMIINNMFEMLSAYSNNFWHSIVFDQLKTFVCTVSDKGKEMWGPANKKHFRDDTLFSTTFSYICAEKCFPELEPFNSKKQDSAFVIRHELVRDKNGKLKRIPVKKSLRHGR